MFRNILAAVKDAAKSLLMPGVGHLPHYSDRELAQLTLNSIGDAVLSIDLAGNVTYLNPVATEMTGWSSQKAIGRPLGEVLRIIDGDTRAAALDPLALAMRYDKTVGLCANSLLISREGYEAAIADTSAPIHDHEGRVTGAVIVFHDVSAARALSMRMSHLAQHDSLTDLPNRMLLHDRLAQAIAAAARHRNSLAVLYIDIDQFKQVNDTLGHAAGDQLLRSIAQRLVASVRATDTVCRQGGDEFVVLLSEVARSGDASSSADKIKAALAAPHHVAGKELRVTASIGIAVWPADGADAESLLAGADSAMLKAKAAVHTSVAGLLTKQLPRLSQRM